MKKIFSIAGFPQIVADQLKDRGSDLIIPPLNIGDVQFSEQQNRYGYEVARLRIHVEVWLLDILNFDNKKISVAPFGLDQVILQTTYQNFTLLQSVEYETPWLLDRYDFQNNK